MYISYVTKATSLLMCFYSLTYSLLIAYVSSYPDGGCRNHMGVAHSSCYKLDCGYPGCRQAKEAVVIVMNWLINCHRDDCISNLT